MYVDQTHSVHQLSGGQRIRGYYAPTTEQDLDRKLSILDIEKKIDIQGSNHYRGFQVAKGNEYGERPMKWVVSLTSGQDCRRWWWLGTKQR